MGEHLPYLNATVSINHPAMIPSYLKSAVELTDIMLRLLEQYSSKNQFMFVRRKIRQKKKQGKCEDPRFRLFDAYFDSKMRRRTKGRMGMTRRKMKNAKPRWPIASTFSSLMPLKRWVGFIPHCWIQLVIRHDRNICTMTLSGYIVYFLSNWIPWNHILSFVLQIYSIESWWSANVSRFSTR